MRNQAAMIFYRVEYAERAKPENCVPSIYPVNGLRGCQLLISRDMVIVVMAATPSRPSRDPWWGPQVPDSRIHHRTRSNESIANQEFSRFDRLQVTEPVGARGCDEASLRG